MSTKPKYEKVTMACVRYDLRIMLVDVEVTPGGANIYKRGDQEKLDRFCGGKPWEWMYWILRGTSQGSHGQPLREPFLSLHKAIKAAEKD